MKLSDGASLVHSLRLDKSIKTFSDYAEKNVMSFIEKHLASTKHVVIWTSSVFGEFIQQPILFTYA